jgi:hypothetical protein
VKRLRAAGLAALTMTGCATTRPLAAAGDVHALLIAVRDDDRQAFETHVDRPALRAHIQARIVAHAKAMNRGATFDALGVLLSGPASAAADSLLVRPQVFRAVAEYYGYRPGSPIPGPLALSTVLKDGPDGTVCATSGRNGPCVLTFAHETTVWRLVDIDPEAVTTRGARR